MCLGIPMRIEAVEGDEAVVVAGGIRKKIRLDLVEGVGKGDYVLIHTGYAIEKLDPAEAAETLDLIKKVYKAGMTRDAEGAGD